jgi:hypothetical protein
MTQINTDNADKNCPQIAQIFTDYWYKNPRNLRNLRTLVFPFALIRAHSRTLGIPRHLFLSAQSAVLWGKDYPCNLSSFMAQSADPCVSIRAYSRAFADPRDSVSSAGHLCNLRLTVIPFALIRAMRGPS